MGCLSCFKKNNKVDDEKNENTGSVDSFLQANRSCRDVIMLLFFICFWIGMFVICGVAVDKGDPWRLIYATDYNGDTCSDRYIYYPHPDDDINLYSVAGGVDIETAWEDIHFWGICVDSCPEIGDYVCSYDLQAKAEEEEWTTSDYEDYVIYTKCKDDWFYTENYDDCVKGEDLESDQGCWRISVKLENYFFRCLQVTQKNETTEWVCTSPARVDPDCSDQDYELGLSGNSTGCIRSAEECEQWRKTTVTVEYQAEGEDENNILYDQLTAYAQLWNKYFGDIINGWVPIVVFGAVYALAAGFIWLLLLKLFAWIMVWFSILGFLTVSIGFTLYCYSKAEFIDSDEVDAIVENGNEYVPLEDNSDDQKKQFLYMGHFFACFTLLFLLLIIGLRRKIQIALGIIVEASRALRKIPTLVFYPIVTFLLCTGTIAYGLVVGAYIATCGDISLDDLQNQVTDVSGIEYNITISNTTFPEYVSTSTFTKGLLAYHFFGILWTNAFFLAMGECVIAGAVAQYYWTRDKDALPFSPVLTSFKRTVFYHLGSIAYGSLLVAIVQFIRAVLMYIESRSKKLKDNKVAKFILACLKCFLWCLEKFIKFINRNAYIIIAIKGTSFCSAAREAFFLILENIMQVAAVNVISSFLLALGKLFIAFSAAILAFLYIDGNSAYDAGGSKELNSPILPVILTFLLALLVAYGFMSVYNMAIDTILLSFCLDRKLHGGPPNTYAPESLAKYLKRTKELAENEKQLNSDIATEAKTAA
eukprot:TRINITY_DN1137_c0_g1::TRINITY_DN1137_c0_g1_i1::g.17256::m.17256 TRINITY_DN1137_c0_g1::TRINITY_DN1137_c0_g1_i1::g.17256  ORF type:complete len:759 (-),score=172.72,sp/B0JZD0/CTL5_XENTR/28.89/7e-83,Choline_transpo/PF04515.7/85,Choline_transpo/PF04515.7/75,Choline_transpo/PF04515.7/2.5e-101,TMEM192/PF14802.1/4.3e+02,TMEM192/PF14802.1/0.061,DUF1289/PF06945.8/0.25 TRINITY_DN1137_c0_g1_i1:232-2508(-)